MGRGAIPGLHQRPKGEDSGHNNGVCRPQECRGCEKSVGLSQAVRRRGQEKIRSSFAMRVSRPSLGRCRLDRESSDCLLVRTIFRPTSALRLVLKLVRAKWLAVAGRAAALKVTHHRGVNAGRVKPKCLQVAIEEISRL